VLYPASHYTVGQEEQKARVLDDIAAECASAVDALLANGQVPALAPSFTPLFTPSLAFPLLL